MALGAKRRAWRRAWLGQSLAWEVPGLLGARPAQSLAWAAVLVPLHCSSPKALPSPLEFEKKVN